MRAAKILGVLFFIIVLWTTVGMGIHCMYTS